MKKAAKFAPLAALACFFSHPAAAEIKIGAPAPDFTAKAASGKNVKLSDYKGKIVVLEWTNPGCPFVKKFYGAGKMQALQTDAMKKGAVWLSVNSSAEGKQGAVDAAGAKAFMDSAKAAPTEYLLDARGDIGRLYGARTTPHMFVIDATGALAYQGAMDDKPTPHPEDIEGAHNYVSAALDAVMGGNNVETPSTQSYGCNVKY